MDSTDKNLYFTNSHEWIKIDGDEAIIGITKHAEQLLGDLVFVELPEVGSQFDAKQEMVIVESVKAASDVYAPMAGEVIAVNDALTDEPGQVNASPFDAGWLVKLKLTDSSATSELMRYEEYEALVTEEA